MRHALTVLAALLSAALAACSAGVGGDWPAPPGGVLASCHGRGDRCGGSGWCGPTPAGALTCCPVELDATGYCPAGEVPGVVECLEDADCPREECREVPVCLGGVCFGALRAWDTCTTGVCDEQGACKACTSNDDCQRGNTNECHDFACMSDGSCQPSQRKPGEACRVSNGTCTPSAECSAL